MTKHLKYIIPIAIVLSLVGFFLSHKLKKPKEEETIETRKVEQINKLPVKQRPYITLTPRADGKEVTLTIDNLTNASQAEYELEYQAGSMIQGVFGSIDFQKEELPVSKNLLFGSCSKGKCRYDENVTGGSLTLRFEGGDEPYVLKTDFNLQLMSQHEGVFASKDIKAKLDVGKSGLPASTYVIIANTLGLPVDLDGEIIAGPYAFLAAQTQKFNGTLTIQSKEDLTSAKLFYYNGSDWTEITLEIDNNKITAPVTNLGTYIVVSQE